MPTDFRDAADRHFGDADLLSSNNHVANADHLFGLSAECALKAVMLGLGMHLKPNGAPTETRHKVHINKLWPEFSTFALGRKGTKYATAIDPTANPFNDYDVDQRYSHRSDITDATLNGHKTGAETAMKVLITAKLDGVL